MSHEFEGERRVVYGDGYFLRRCPKCWRFVKADAEARVRGGEPNATCKVHGRVEMIFEGQY